MAQYSIKLNRRLTIIEEAKIYFTPKTDTGKLKTQQAENANKIVKLMNTHFDINEVHDLCLDLQVDFDNLLGERKIDKIKAYKPIISIVLSGLISSKTLSCVFGSITFFKAEF